MPDINNRHGRNVSNSSNNSSGNTHHHHRNFSATVDSHGFVPKSNNHRTSLTPPTTNNQDFQKLNKKIENMESEVTYLRMESHFQFFCFGLTR